MNANLKGLLLLMMLLGNIVLVVSGGSWAAHRLSEANTVANFAGLGVVVLGAPLLAWANYMLGKGLLK